MNLSPGHRRVRLATALAAALVSAAAGCSLLGKPVPDASRYFVLSLDGSSVAASAAKRSDVHFGIGPVTLPNYLDAQSLVRTNDANAVEYLRDAYWAEPLSASFPRVLLHHVSTRLGSMHGVAFPWYGTTRVDWRVPVDVLRFEATTAGKVVLVVRWKLERASDGSLVAGGESRFEEEAGPDAAAVARGLGACVDRLAATIADAMAAQPKVSAAPAAATR